MVEICRNKSSVEQRTTMQNSEHMVAITIIIVIMVVKVMAMATTRMMMMMMKKKKKKNKNNIFLSAKVRRGTDHKQHHCDKTVLGGIENRAPARWVTCPGGRRKRDSISHPDIYEVIIWFNV